jgi:hypothetical protein
MAFIPSIPVGTLLRNDRGNNRGVHIDASASDLQVLPPLSLNFVVIVIALMLTDGQVQRFMVQCNMKR